MGGGAAAGHRPRRGKWWKAVGGGGRRGSRARRIDARWCPDLMPWLGGCSLALMTAAAGVSCAGRERGRAQRSAQATPHRSHALPTPLPSPSDRHSTLIITQLPSTTKRHSSDHSASPSSSSSPPTLNCCHSAIASPTSTTASLPLPDLSYLRPATSLH